jgi:hypothetical protein
MMVNYSRIVLLILVLCWGGPVEGQICSSTVDFAAQQLICWGLGGTPWEQQVAPEEERSRAWMDGLHHAYDAILELPLMEGMDVRHAVLANPSLKERLGQLLLAAPKTFFQPDRSGLVRCRLHIPFTGGMSLRSALYLAALRPARAEPLGFVASTTAIASGSRRPMTDAEDDDYARMVLDVRRTRFEPSLFPRFFSEEGHLLFQEGLIPGPFRFSRPVVRFTTAIEDAEKGLKSYDVMYVSAYVSPLMKRDVRVAAPDAEIFHRFCQVLEKEPERNREILIVYGNERPYGGLLP